MSIRLYKSYTPGTRNRALSTFSEITKSKPEKSLIRKNHRNKGRNNRGVITIRHRGGGHKRKYRLIDFQRNKHNVEGTIASIEYDPNRNARIALVNYQDGEKRYILHPNNIKVGDKMFSVDENTTLDDFLKHQKVYTRNLATSVNADLILKDKRKDKVLKEKDQINIFGPITGG